MSDVDRDPQVERLLHGVGAEVAGYVDPPGVATAYATVRQRRRNRAVATGVLALVLLGGPSVGLALANDRGGPPPGVDPSPTAPVQPPSPSTSPSPSAPPTSSPTPSAPDGRISLAELRNTTLDLPPWPREAATTCTAGDEEFVGQPVYVDVDHDGAKETAVLLRCQPPAEYKVFKVMVFDRDAAGKVVTLGQVLESPGEGEEGVAIWRIHGIEAAPGGQIRVDVGDYFPCCGTAPDLPQHQWRTYGWDGRRFTQTGGPTAFGPNPKVTDLRLAADDLVMTKQADGTWRGRLTFTVRNAGPVGADIDLNIWSETRLAATGGGWTGWLNPPDGSDLVAAGRVVADLAVGASRTVTLDFTSAARPSGTLDVRTSHVDGTGHRSYPDKNSDDNRIRVAIRAG